MALVVADLAGQLPALWRLSSARPPTPIRLTYLVLLLYPCLALLVWFITPERDQP